MAAVRVPLADAQRAFREFAAGVGLDMGHDPVPTTRGPTRFDVRVGAKVKRKRGWYVFHADGRPAGIVADHAGARHRWVYNGEVASFDRAEWAAERARMRETARVRRREQLEAERAATAQARQKWSVTAPADAKHPYLVAKGVGVHNARRLGNKLVIPAYGSDGEVQTIQTIGPDGAKLWHAGAPKRGAYSMLGMAPPGKMLVLCEGWATGASIAEAVPDAAVVVAFDAGNLELVAREVRRRWPRADLVIAADDDWETEARRPDIGNVGMRKAEAVARLLGARLAVPDVRDTPGASDFNDMARVRAGFAVAARVREAKPQGARIDEPLPDPSPEVVAEAVASIIADAHGPRADWREELLYSKGSDGEQPKLAKRDIGNMRLMLTHHPEMEGTFRFDRFGQRIMLWGASWGERADVRAWTDADVPALREWMQRKGLQPSEGEVHGAALRAALARSYDPVVDWLDGLTWDGTERLDHWLEDYCGATSPFARVVAAKVLIAAVARAYRPGCKVDNMLVLEGAQGARKSSGIAALFGEAVTRSSTNVFESAKTLVETVTGSWCVEVAEFASVLRTDRDRVTALITTQVDKVRLSYGRVAQDFHRRCVFVGTINPGDNGYFGDLTGNRRYWPVTVDDVDAEGLRTGRDQLWAEAVHRFRTGEPWWLVDEGDIELARAEQAARLETHPWDDLLRHRPEFMARPHVTTQEALAAVGVPSHQMTNGQAKIMAGVMRRIGWEQRVMRMNGQLVRAWVRA